MKNHALIQYANFLLQRSKSLYQHKQYHQAFGCIQGLMQTMEISLRSKENTKTEALFALTLIRKMKRCYESKQSLSCLRACLLLIANNFLSIDLVMPWAKKACSQFEEHINKKLEKVAKREKQWALDIKQQDQGFFKLVNLALSEKENRYNSGSKKLSHQMLEEGITEIATKLQSQLAQLKSPMSYSDEDSRQSHHKKINLLERRLKHCDTLRAKITERAAIANPHNLSSPATVSASLSPHTTMSKGIKAASMGNNLCGLIQEPKQNQQTENDFLENQRHYDEISFK